MLANVMGLDPAAVAIVTERLAQRPRRRGRPWARPLRLRVVIACVGLRTNLTVRELAGVFALSKSQVHRILADLTPRLAALLPTTIDGDRRWSWIVDGTLIPTRDHATAAKSKNYRWSTNAQVLVRRADLHVLAVTAGGPGNRNDPCTTVAPTCRSYVGSIVGCSPTAAIAASQSSSRPPSARTASSETERGADIENAAPASSTPSLA
jgi:hypothetical protein